MTPLFRIASLALATALVAACASTEPYTAQVPAIRVPAQYARADSNDRPAVVNLPALDADRMREVRADPWWQGFQDQRLNRMVEQALASNADLAAAGFALHQARLQSQLASNAMRPQLGGGVDSSASRLLDRGGSTQRDHSVNASLSWELDLFGRLQAQREVQLWRAQASEDDLQATALTLVAEVSRQYWTLAYLSQSIRAAEEDLAALDRIAQLVTDQHAQGQVSRLELQEAQQTLQSQRAALAVLTQQRTEVRNALAVLLDGRPWPPQDEPPSLQAAAVLDIREGMPAELLARRPDLRAAERRLRASLANVDATARSHYPAFTLTGALGSSSDVLSRVLRNPVATLGVGLTLPFLNLDRLHLSTELAGTAYLQAASEFRTTLHTALMEVENALSAKARLQLQLESRQAAHEAAREVARLYEVRYREGASALRTWLDAQHVLRNAEIQLAQTRRELVTNDVNLMLALGGS